MNENEEPRKITARLQWNGSYRIVEESLASLFAQVSHVGLRRRWWISLCSFAAEQAGIDQKFVLDKSKGAQNEEKMLEFLSTSIHAARSVWCRIFAFVQIGDTASCSWNSNKLNLVTLSRNWRQSWIFVHTSSIWITWAWIVHLKYVALLWRGNDVPMRNPASAQNVSNLSTLRDILLLPLDDNTFQVCIHHRSDGYCLTMIEAGSLPWPERRHFFVCRTRKGVGSSRIVKIMYCPMTAGAFYAVWCLILTRPLSFSTSGYVC